VKPDVMTSGLATDATVTAPAPKRRNAGPHQTPGAADVIEPVLRSLLNGPVPTRFEFWDGSSLGPSDGPGPIHVRSPCAVNRLLCAPGELGIGRAYGTGELQMDGDLFVLLQTLHAATPSNLNAGARLPFLALRAARRLGILGLPLDPPSVEAAPRGRRHSKNRDAQAISHHYDISNEFYLAVLGPSLTYSCARFVDQSATLEEAQASKHDLICRKLGLHDRPGMRLLDVGCGWGSMALHAAQRYGASVVGVTRSAAQADLARTRVAEAGLTDQVEIRAGLPRPRWGTVRRHLVDRHVRTRRHGEDGGLLHARCTHRHRPPP
jgi:cyclopropane-fatty-acyl-phospholipid synthase